MKAGWEEKTLEKICSFSNGLWKGKKPPYINVGVIRNTNFTKLGALDDSNIAYLDVEERQFQKRSLEFDDLIIEKSGGGPKQPVGRVIIFKKKAGDFSFSNFTSVIRVQDKSLVEPDFLHKYLYWLYVSGVTEKMQSHSTGIRNLNFKEYKQLQIPLPPLAEQKQIVSVLDAAFAAIERAAQAARKNRDNARELFETTLNASFTQKGEGWVETTLGEVCGLLNGFAFKSGDTVEVSDVQLVRMGNLYQNELNLERKPCFYPSGFAQEYRRYTLSEGDLIISLTGTVGKRDYGFTVEIPKVDRALLLNQRIAKITDIQSKVVDRRLLLFAMRSQSFLDSLYGSARGVRQANLSSGAMKKLPLLLPPIDDQEPLINRLNELSNISQRLEALYQQKLDALDELKQSLLQKAFSGELTADFVADKAEDALAN